MSWSGTLGVRKMGPLVARCAIGALAVAMLGSGRSALADGPVTVTASIDREVTAVGDWIALTVEVVRPAEILISTPAALGFGGDIEPVESLPPEHTSPGDGTTHSVFRYTIAAYRTGPHELAPVAVPYTNLDGSTGVATSNKVSFTIRSVIPPGQNPSDIRDIKPQLGLGGGTPSSVYRPLLAALLVLDLGLVVMALRRQSLPRTRRTPKPLPVPANPWLAQLDAIAAERLAESGDYKAFYRRVAVIVRAFLADRYGVPARALTRAELERRMASAGLDQWQARLVNGLLQEADRVVYAEYAPARERAEGALGLAYQVVELGSASTQEPVLVRA